MKTVDDALELRARIFGAFEMAEMEEDPELQRRVADVRGDRRRAHGRGDGRTDRRALEALAEAQLPPDRSGQRAGAAVRRRRGAARHLRRQALRESHEGDRTHGRSAAHAKPRDRRQTRGDRRAGPGRRGTRRVPHEGVVGGRAGLAAGRRCWREATGAGDRPRRARRGARPTARCRAIRRCSSSAT